jgi:hypothetical protein
MRIVLLVALVTGCADRSPETTMTCPQSIGAWCSENIHFCPTWKDAQDPHTWGCQGTLVLQTCGDHKVASLAGTDTSTDFTYSVDGSLIGISSFNANSHATTCDAGTALVEPCSDPNAQHIPLCPP